MRGILALAVVAVGSPVLSQKAPGEKPVPIGRQATRLVRLLELPSRRVVSAREILKLGKHAVPALTRAMNDPRPEVVGRVAILIRMLGNDAKPAIPTLRELARGKDKKLAYAAQWALSTFHPVGVTLVADYSRGRIVEFDETGKELLEIRNLKGVFDADRLPNGNYLIAMAGEERVREIDREGKVIWEYHQKSMNPLGAARLPNDHTLIANTNGELLEVDTKSRVVWRAKGFHAWTVQPLRNGNVLIADGASAAEVNRDGKRVRMIKLAPQCHEARRLPNGHTLLSSYNTKQVVEVDDLGNKVGTLAVGGAVDTAIRTPDGATIAGGQGFVRKYAADGKLLWSRKVGRAGTVHYY